MLNSKPNNSNYHQGLYIPKNKDKVLKLNNQGGLYYRSGLEKKAMIFFDYSDKVIRWSAEGFKVDYVKTDWDNDKQGLVSSKHNYYPDFYYEMKKSDGSIVKVVAEVKPHSETVEPILKENATVKQLKNFEYSLKMWNKNLSKWKYMIAFCEKKGFEFIIITDKFLSKF